MSSKSTVQILKKEESISPLFLEIFGWPRIIIKIYSRVYAVKRRAILTSIMKNIHLI
jgi:hypothetical protein